jgi:hypothetical protein
VTARRCRTGATRKAERSGGMCARSSTVRGNQQAIGDAIAHSAGSGRH